MDETAREQEMDRLRLQIAETVKEREAMKQALEQGAVSPTQGLRRLERIDARLSALDSHFKCLWDRAHSPRTI